MHQPKQNDQVEKVLPIQNNMCLTINQARAKFGLPPLPDPRADQVLVVQSNHITVD